MPNFIKKIKRTYNILASDLKFSEIEHLIKTETPGIYEFYTRDNQQAMEKRKGLFRIFSLLKNLFVAFILKLTPVRRIIYLICLYFFASGLITINKFQLILGFLILNTILAFELADKLVAKDELEVARKIQNQLSPKKPPEHPHYEISFFTETAREVGGDFCHFISNGRPDDSLVIIVGDISGKGMRAALHMVQVHTIIQTLKGYNDIKQFLIDLNEQLSLILPDTVFFTSNVVELTTTGDINLCRAGHMPILHFSVKSGKCTRYTPAGLGMGLTNKKKFQDILEKISIKPAKGDIFLLYTDGLVETRNRNNVELGEEKLEAVFCEHAELPAGEIRDLILKHVAGFRRSAVPIDDSTLVVFKYKGS